MSRCLPDGRVAAFVVLNEPLLPPAGPETLLFVFANQDGQWLVDDWIDFSIVPPNFGAEATPRRLAGSIASSKGAPPGMIPGGAASCDAAIARLTG